MTDTMTAGPGAVTNVTPELLERWLGEGETVLIDVREDFEYAEEHLEDAHLVPPSQLDPDAIRSEYAGRRIVFYCRTGRRSAEAAERVRRDDERAFHLAGGIEAWKAAGRPCIRPASAPRIGVMRQVQMTAGGLVAAGTALGFFVSPWFLIVPAFVGCGLVFAGASGWCGMALLLGRMPWNARTCSIPGQ